MENPIMILGAQELGRVALEIFQQNGCTVYGFLDEDETLWGTTIHHVPVLGSTSTARYLALIGEKCDVFVATTQRVQQQRLAKMLQVQKKVVPINAIHASHRRHHTVFCADCHLVVFMLFCADSLFVWSFSYCFCDIHRVLKKTNRVLKNG